MRGGTNTDGSKSTMYCSQCYINGVFVNSEINTAEKMQALVKSKLKDMGFPGLLAWFFTMNIPKLRRWSGV